MLKGIEAQMMVTRTADLAREAGVLQRKNDLVRDYLAQQTQALAEQEKQQVAQTLKAQQVAIGKDKQGSGRQETSEQYGERSEFTDEIEDDYTIPSLGNYSTIDIKI